MRAARRGWSITRRPADGRLLALIMGIAAAALPLPGPAAAITEGASSGYCDPSAGPLSDPIDVPARGSGPGGRPGVRERTITVAGRATRVLESGSPKGRTGVVLVHGIPGSAADWSDLLPRIGDRRTRAVALDMPGFGHAGDAWGLGRSPDVGATFLDRALVELGIERVHLVAHDIGGPVALQWASRQPKRLRSATLLNTGLLLGYRHHSLAQISRPAGAGELFWFGLNRTVFSAGLQVGQTRPLPAGTLNRWYDDLDRETRCTILETYRSGDEADVDALARRQADVLARRRTRPALVIWGADDPYLPVQMAERQREGFPRARIEIFEDTGHWPVIDDVTRTDQLVVPFVRRAIARDRRSHRIRP
ncbi:MAG: alpha/beta hydrolase [Solirubrobacterales bacterium]|nr:alpha/beta hydrolase [Solirubrobacterales bacterium]